MIDIITRILTLFGISQQPVTVQEFLWDIIILIVGMFVVKWILVTVFGLIKFLMKF